MQKQKQLKENVEEKGIFSFKILYLLIFREREEEAEGKPLIFCFT